MNNSWPVRTVLLSFLAIFMFAGSVLAQEKLNSAAKEDGSEAKPAGENSGKTKAEENEPEAGSGTEALQKSTQNPVASLISVPLQNNNNFGVSPGYRTQDVLNIRPVVPIGISRDRNLIIRWITPILWQPLPSQPSTPETGTFGLGDMLPSFFLCPAKPGKLIWDSGPVVQLPTATNTFLGQGKLGIEPSAVALTQPGHLTLGVLVKGWYITWQPP